jgi:hypothetical protein
MSQGQMMAQMELQFRVQSVQLAISLHAAHQVKDEVVLATARAIETYLKGSQLNLVK